MEKKVKGIFTELDGESFYKIENYDYMEDFFITITSSCDVWNFLWSQGGITAGRTDSNHALFPYYTADKVSDMKSVTGHYASIALQEGVKTIFWEPFAPLLARTGSRFIKEEGITRNIYKNLNGTKVWFEEVNERLSLSFRYGWTSSSKFGLVRLARIENLSDQKRELFILDGCRNILPACITSDFQNANSVLLDAYKQTDLMEDEKLALFALSSVVTDKAEPSEALAANVSYFTVDSPLYISESCIQSFFENEGKAENIPATNIVKGERPSCFIIQKISLQSQQCQSWEQVFDTSLTPAKVLSLAEMLKDRNLLRRDLLEDIENCDKLMTTYISESDGIQKNDDMISCIHHRANVMFNIMRGGFFADNGRINCPDFLSFVKERNKGKYQKAEKILAPLRDKNSIERKVFEQEIAKSDDPQLTRLFLEYMPLIFSRRHGDPSRPWNKFNIRIVDEKQNPILNYEGNWRDIFQNWEALAMSYPSYIPNMVAKFLNAMTADGFNPYRISRAGIDWECPDPTNPWAQYGYWGDHQVIYLQKFLELWQQTDEKVLLENLDTKIYSSSNVPYRLKSYSEILKAPHSSIIFDKELSDRLIEKSKEEGSDAKLVLDEDGQVALVSLTAKILQIVIAKASNLVPGGGIWMNTQRPEWNDANNALAGWGLSVVTLCYLHRMLSFLKDLYKSVSGENFTLPLSIKTAFEELVALYKKTDAVKAIEDDCERKNFTDAAGYIFEVERESLYSQGYGKEEGKVTGDQIATALETIRKIVERTITANKRDDGLYHTYNTMIAFKDKMKICRLPQMLEGQVAVLSADLLKADEVVSLLAALKASPLYEKRQGSYILYPNKNLPHFMQKNIVKAEDAIATAVLEEDLRGFFHFAPDFRNARILKDYLLSLEDEKRPSDSEVEKLLALYEKTFNHQNFTGRSGTFYAYEGLGSIYWHMVSKLLLAVQENAVKAFKTGDPCAEKLKVAYYDVRSGLGFNKEPSLYGAFPFDPYSHTPFGRGAKQPGMTGQVKEEILTRWGELGVSFADGRACFNPWLLEGNREMSFTWCGVKVEYARGQRHISVTRKDGSIKDYPNSSLSEDETKDLLERNGKIEKIKVTV